jgi:hypothetical protein
MRNIDTVYANCSILFSEKKLLCCQDSDNPADDVVGQCIHSMLTNLLTKASHMNYIVCCFMGLLLRFWLQYVRDAMYVDCCLLLYSENASLPFIDNPSLFLFLGNSWC